jgi:signal transduction histidine kinase
MSDVATERSSIQRWQRRLLPGELVQVPFTRRSPRDWIVDSALFLLAVAVGVVTLAETWGDHGAFQLLLEFTLGVAACLALWLRRSRPVAVGLLAVVAGAFTVLAGGAAVVAVFNLAVRGSRRALVWIGVLSLAAIVVVPLIYPSAGSFPTQVLFGVLIFGVAISLGLFTRVRRELVLSLRDRAERLESEQRMHVEQARDAERRRLAREMHDVLAHRLSLLSVQAGALEFHPKASPEEVSEAAGVIRRSAHAALQELRDVIGVLREDGDERIPQPPQPTFAQIPALVEESRAAGMNVRLNDETQPAEEIPAALGRTAYRVVQEGLTNARKHAPAAAVEVTIAADADSLIIEVVSRPAVGVPAAGPLVQAGRGRGLVGLTERVALSGGDLHYGTDDKGDFVLRARLPLSA